MPLKSRFRASTSQMPEINLVPMMDVLMTILTFFIIISMTMTAQQQSVNIDLPSTNAGANTVKTPDPLVVGLTNQGTLEVANNAVTDAQLSQQMQVYLQTNPNGAVVLQADKKLPYEQVVQVLGKMRDVGGDRVSLAIDSN
ncbi:ExbD/TolR family protein [Chlorogloea sp. CCALA 695]|uniref:ExbD/TolR family protein n=1 Tax=Chlorogloea sp. CCALA 695 TaxID=2107693 RepID=UPI000D0790BD|nr:biopolymer transporter ExbD [Chlorogloea sp. CCALA 695]PSB35299.1 biopolymer transporter ExbD [Chlorogloea sp. CCALA 695]